LTNAEEGQPLHCTEGNSDGIDIGPKKFDFKNEGDQHKFKQ